MQGFQEMRNPSNSMLSISRIYSCVCWKSSETLVGLLVESGPGKMPFSKCITCLLSFLYFFSINLVQLLCVSISFRTGRYNANLLCSTFPQRFFLFPIELSIKFYVGFRCTLCNSRFFSVKSWHFSLRLHPTPPTLEHILSHVHY
jgi:hypothetical protein